MSTATDWLTHPHQRRGYVLQVAGLEYRYVSHGGITAGSPGGLGSHVDDAGEVPYVEALAIKSVGNAGAEVDVAGGVAEYDPIQVQLATLGRYAEAGDPGIIFGRSPRGPGAVATLDATVSQVDTTFTVSSTAGFAVDGLYHIGGETVQCSAVGVGAVDVVRAQGGTTPQVHTSNTDTGDVPVIYDRVVRWRTRRATLLCCGLDEHGRRVTDFVEVMRGFIDETPQPAGANLLNLVLAPLTALLDVELAAPQKSTRLVNGYHYFTPPYACTLVHGQEVTVPGLRLDGAAVAGSPVEWPCEDSGLAAWEATFDVGGLGGTYPGHPRIGVVDAGGRQPDDWIGGTAPSAGGTGIEGDELSATAASGDEFPGPFALYAREAVAVNILDADDAAQGLAWPDAAVDAINGASPSWTPGDHTGLNGAWFDVALTLEGAEGPALRIRPNIIGADGRATTGAVTFFNGFATGWSPDRDADPAAYAEWRTGEARAVPRPPYALWYGIDFGGDSNNLSPAFGRRLLHSPAFGSDVLTAAIGGVASGFYQPGEPEILVEDDLPIPAGSSQRISIDFYDPGLDLELSTSCRVTASTAVSVGGSVVGYRLTIHEDDRWSLPAFGDWPGQQRCRITPVLQFDAASPGELILTVLQSAGGGSGAAYDSQAFGVGLADADVDTGSFLALAPPPGLERWTFRAEDGATARDIIDPILKAWGAALTMRRDDTGACRVTLTSMAQPSDTEVLATLDADDIVAGDAPPEWGTDERIVNVHEFKIGWDRVKNEPRRTVIIKDNASRNGNREAQSAEYDLRGLELVDGAGVGGDAEVLLRPVFGRLKSLLGDPRRTWTIRTGNGPGLLAEIGAVYRVTSDHLRGYSDTLGVTGAVGRVVRVDLGLQTEPTTLTLVHFPGNGTGWNVSAKVKTVVSATVVEVEANEYSAATAYATGADQRDVDGFAAGDDVLAGSPADADNAASLTIDTATRATNRIEFTGAHGLSVGDVIWPPAYDSASDAHRALAYIADGNAELGAANDPAQKYV